MSRVLLVGKGEPDRGGIPTFLKLLCHGYLARQHELTFLNVAHLDTPQGGKATASNLRRTLKDAFAVWRFAGQQDIVHIHSALAPTVTILRASALALVARARGCAVVVHAHGGNIETWLNSAARLHLMRLAMLPAHRVVAVWTAGHRALSRALGADRVALVDNGVDADLFDASQRTHEPPRILYVGLLTPRKGVLDLLDASEILRQRGVQHELFLLGGMPDEGPEAAVPVHAAAEGRASLLGTRTHEEMPAVYAGADVFCLPSWWEAMPLSVLEAMASGLPVVATDVGDVRRALGDDEAGFVVPKRSPESLADALQLLTCDADLRQQVGAAARSRVKDHFSSEATARAVNEIYAQVECERR